MPELGSITDAFCWGMRCEAHPWLDWPHGDCAGPGIPAPQPPFLVHDRPLLVWNGKRVETIGELTDAVSSLETPEQAQEFMALYQRADPDVAEANAGYVTGYLGSQRAVELRGWLDAPHPYFGMGTPPDREALETGIRVGMGEFR